MRDLFPPTPIRYGILLRLRHQESQLYLRSLAIPYNHLNSSQQSMIVGAAHVDDQSCWLIKPRHELRGSRADEVVRHGDIIRLENVATHLNLHSHRHPSPFAVCHGHRQQEVSGFGSGGAGVGDIQDDWRIDLDTPGGTWLASSPVRLCHVTTGVFLHSHGLADPVLTNGKQEVTGVQIPDGNSLWRADVIAPTGSANEKQKRNSPEVSIESWPGFASLLLSRYGIGAIIAAICLAGLSWFFAHFSAAPGKSVRILWGLSEYTKRDSLPTNSFKPALTTDHDGPMQTSKVSAPTERIEIQHISELSNEVNIKELRKAHSLRSLTTFETERRLREIPSGTFFYVFDPFGNGLNFPDVEINTATNAPSPPFNHVEVHKREIYWAVLFVTDGDAARLARNPESGGASSLEVTASTVPSEQFRNLAYIPFPSIATGRLRVVRVSNAPTLGLVDLVLRR